MISFPSPSPTIGLNIRIVLISNCNYSILVHYLFCRNRFPILSLILNHPVGECLTHYVNMIAHSLSHVVYGRPLPSYLSLQGGAVGWAPRFESCAEVCRGVEGCGGVWRGAGRRPSAVLAGYRCRYDRQARSRCDDSDAMNTNEGSVNHPITLAAAYVPPVLLACLTAMGASGC